MIKRRVGQYYVESTYAVMLVTDMTGGGIYAIDEDKYPEENIIDGDITADYLATKINSWLDYYAYNGGIRVDPGLVDIAMKHLFGIDLEPYLKRVSMEGRERIMLPFERASVALGNSIGTTVFFPAQEDIEKIPIMLKPESSHRFAFVMPMLKFKDKNFPKNVSKT